MMMVVVVVVVRKVVQKVVRKKPFFEGCHTVIFLWKNCLNASQNRVNASADHTTTLELKK